MRRENISKNVSNSKAVPMYCMSMRQTCALLIRDMDPVKIPPPILLSTD